MHRPPPPNISDLLLPLLACLPTAFLSPRPPPALPPLLSPILRQRLHLSSQPTTQENQTWLSLLTWSTHLSAALTDVISNFNLEPHPISGELEPFANDPDPESSARPSYRRRDDETLHARVDVQDLGIGVVWLWCDLEPGAPSNTLDATNELETVQEGWKVAEVLPLEAELEASGCADAAALRAEQGWMPSMGEAEAAYTRERETSRSVMHAASSSAAVSTAPHLDVLRDDEAEYWAAYDGTPAARTPAPLSRLPSVGAVGGDEAYYERYREVQPEMDAEDPDEHDYGKVERANGQRESHVGSSLGMERAMNNGSSKSQQSSVSEPTELAIKQHISTELKSLYRLARGVGVERAEFERVVRTELDVLGLAEL